MNLMKKLLTFAAVSEAATGVALLIVPSFLGQLLFGAELTGVAMTVARVTGIALIGLGLACLPGSDEAVLLLGYFGQCCPTACSQRCTWPIRVFAANGSGACVASGGDPRRFDAPLGSRMAQRSADQEIESIRGSKRPGGRERSSRCLAGRERVKDQ